jgi:hypothetical protein
MRVAFYKGTRQGFSGIYSRGVRFIEKGKYSHCELVFSDGISASASFIDKGVRFKYIDYSNKRDWDFIDVSWADEAVARKYFEDNLSLDYDVKGNLHFLFGVFGDSNNKKFCSEAVAEALGMKEAWLLAPNALYHVLTFINLQIERNNMNAHINQVDDNDPVEDPVEDTGGGNPPVKPPTKP